MRVRFPSPARLPAQVIQDLGDPWQASAQADQNYAAWFSAYADQPGTRITQFRSSQSLGTEVPKIG
jgi:hypothetical protein